MAQFIVTEPGNLLPLVSLGGVISLSGQGRTILSDADALNTGSPHSLYVASNPKRISLIIQNNDDATAPGTPIQVYLGAQSHPVFVYSPGTLQIDRDLPWIGEVVIMSATNNPIATYIEVSLP